MAGMAVDFRLASTRRTRARSAADAALPTASMPAFMAQNSSGAHDTAIRVAGLNGFSSSEASAGATGNKWTVTITKTHPTFFGGIFGMWSKTITATASGLGAPASPGAANVTQAVAGLRRAGGLGGGLRRSSGRRAAEGQRQRGESNKQEIHSRRARRCFCAPQTTCQKKARRTAPAPMFWNDISANLGITGGGNGHDRLIANTLATLDAGFPPSANASTNGVGIYPGA